MKAFSKVEEMVRDDRLHRRAFKKYDANEQRGLEKVIFLEAELVK